jgi:hypothetical protein
LPAATARAADTLFAGSFCQGGGGLEELLYNRNGVLNAGPSSAFVECPFWLPFSDALTVRNVTATVYDRHPSENITCLVLIISMRGEVIAVRQVSSTGFGAGAQFLTVNFNNTQARGTLHLECVIPPFHPVNQYSYLATYRLRTRP